MKLEITTITEKPTERSISVVLKDNGNDFQSAFFDGHTLCLTLSEEKTQELVNLLTTELQRYKGDKSGLL